MRLRSDYFRNEPNPLSKQPSRIISQFQTQAQNAQVQVVLSIQSLSDSRQNEFARDSKEGQFLQRLKDALGGAQDAAQLIRLVVSIAAELGVK